jgi:hypothetical protein
MPSAGSEPAIPASKLPKTHALDRAATGVGTFPGLLLFKYPIMKHNGMQTIELGIPSCVASLYKIVTAYEIQG